jgi:S1-C subfamily serine protease
VQIRKGTVGKGPRGRKRPNRKVLLNRKTAEDDVSAGSKDPGKKKILRSAAPAGPPRRLSTGGKRRQSVAPFIVLPIVVVALILFAVYVVVPAANKAARERDAQRDSYVGEDDDRGATEPQPGPAPAPAQPDAGEQPVKVDDTPPPLPGGGGQTFEPLPAEPRDMSRAERFRRCAPLAVDIVITEPGMESQGAGSILHESGYILTAEHVTYVGQFNYVYLYDGSRYPFTVVHRAGGSYDTAILKIDPGSRKLPMVKFGHSDSVQPNDEAMIIGNPGGGRRHDVRYGPINKPSCGNNTQLQIVYADIQPGHSGGPIFNVRGEQIAHVSVKIHTAPNNTSRNIRVDHFREAMQAIVDSEKDRDIRIGITVDCREDEAVVTGVARGSPAHKAGIRAGDVILQVGDIRVEQSIHYAIVLLELREVGPITVKYRRNGEIKTCGFRPSAPSLLQPTTAENLANGLRCEVYHGSWQSLPSFSGRPVSVKTVSRISHTVAGRSDNFGLKFTGYIEVPRDGKYTFYTTSDDGSRLWIGGKRVVDNDGLHGMQEHSGSVFLAAGKHSFKITFFEATGSEGLSASYSGPGISKREIPSSVLYTRETGTSR